MAHVAWTLTDNSGSSPVVFQFPINPKTWTLSSRQANIVQEQSTAPNGQTIIFQGRDKPVTASFGGTSLTQTFYSDLTTWSNKWYPLTLTDDQGNSWTILFTSLQWTRLKKTNPWAYTYTAKVYVL